MTNPQTPPPKPAKNGNAYIPVSRLADVRKARAIALHHRVLERIQETHQKAALLGQADQGIQASSTADGVTPGHLAHPNQSALVQGSRSPCDEGTNQ